MIAGAVTRRLLNLLTALLTALSLVLCVAATWLWVVSHVAGPTFAAMSYSHRETFAQPRDTGFLLTPGALYLMADQRRGAPPPRGPIPLWPLATLSALLPATAGIRFWRRRSDLRRRKAHGLCPCCGYDLRATQARCPECGTPVGSGTDSGSKK
jgi:hypothetical protein